MLQQYITREIGKACNVDASLDVKNASEHADTTVQ